MSNHVIVDTNVVSYIFKRDSRAIPYLREHLNGKVWVISFMTLAELYQWEIRHQWGPKKKAEMAAYLSHYTVVPFDQSLCLKWAEVTEGCRRKGTPIDCADAWIAATAMLYQVPLITHNAKDYAGVDGLEVVSV